MKNTINTINNCLTSLKTKINGKLTSRRGDSNIIAVILIMVVVIGLAVVFRKQMGEIVSKLFTSVNSSIDSF